MRIYLAGPMRNYPEFNHPAFRQATRTLRAGGHEVFSPAEYDVQAGLDVAGTQGDHEELRGAGFDLRAALGADLAWITSRADAVVVLPGWEESLGVRAEVATAIALGIPVRELGPFLAAGENAGTVTWQQIPAVLTTREAQVMP
jgi:hypothetical protein